jgi:hypothetical protein
MNFAIARMHCHRLLVAGEIPRPFPQHVMKARYNAASDNDANLAKSNHQGVSTRST